MIGARAILDRYPFDECVTMVVTNWPRRVRVRVCVQIKYAVIIIFRYASAIGKTRAMTDDAGFRTG